MGFRLSALIAAAFALGAVACGARTRHEPAPLGKMPPPLAEAGPEDAAAHEPAREDASSADTGAAGQPAARDAKPDDPPATSDDDAGVAAVPDRGRLPPPLTAAGEPQPCAFEPATEAALGAGPSCPDGIHRGDVAIGEPADVAQLAGCTRLEGNLRVIDRLWPGSLSSLRVITGSLDLELAACSGCDASGDNLYSIRGFEGLRCVAGDFFVNAGTGTSRKAAEPFIALREIGGELVLSVKPESLPDAPLFPALERVWGNVSAPATSCFARLDTVYGGLSMPMAAGPRGTISSIAIDPATIPSLRHVGCPVGGHFKCKDGVFGCPVSIEAKSDLEALAGCRYGPGLSFWGEQVTDLSSLRDIQRLPGGLAIDSTPLTTLSGLENLASAGTLQLTGNSRLEDVSAVAGLSGLRKLTVSRNPVLKSLAAWSRLRATPDIEILLDHNPTLETLGEWPWLTSVSKLTIEDNPALQILTGLRALSKAERLQLKDQPQMTDLQGLDGLRNVQWLLLTGLPNLVDLHGIGPLAELGSLDVASCSQLQSLDGLSTPRSIGQLNLSELPQLTSVAALSNVQSVNHMSLATLPKLRSLEQLSQLNALAEIFVWASAFADLRGLEHLTEIEYLHLTGNARLRSLAGLGAVESIMSLALQDNPVLSDLHALGNLHSAEGLRIENNAALSTCEVEWLGRAVDKLDQVQGAINGGDLGCR